MSIWKKIFGKKQQAKVGQTEESLDQRYSKLIDSLEKFKRRAYIPSIQEVEPQHNSNSKIGGLPFLRFKDDWPICPSCKTRMQFFMQLDLSKLPLRASSGLVQLFYCTNEDPFCGDELESYLPFSKASVCRRIDIDVSSYRGDHDLTKVYNEKQFVGWTTKDDYPDYEEWGSLGINQDIDDDVFDLMDERGEGVALEGDKLFGWPHWVQSVEYPYDRQSGKQMDLLFQLDSMVNLPYMFGDAGIGHITVSADNPDELGFGWACS